MTSLLRHGGLQDGIAVLPLDLTSQAQVFPNAGQTAKSPLNHKGLSPLEREIAELREALKDSARAATQAVATAREDARREAEQAFQRDEARSLDLLREGLACALSSTSAQVAALETMGLALCEGALTKVFANPQKHHALIADAIARQVASIRRETVLRVHVCSSDFPAPEALAKLAQALGMSPADISADGRLSPGEARIDVRLGHIELSIPGYWDALKATLRDLALGDAP